MRGTTLHMMPIKTVANERLVLWERIESSAERSFR